MSGTTTPAFAAEAEAKQAAYETHRHTHTAPFLGSEATMKRDEADQAANAFWNQTVAAGTSGSRGQPVAIAERASERAAERVENKRETKREARAEETEAQTQGRGMRL